MPFSAQSLDFLFENRLHDSKSWFDEHKETFQTLVLQPLQQLSIQERLLPWQLNLYRIGLHQAQPSTLIQLILYLHLSLIAQGNTL